MFVLIERWLERGWYGDRDLPTKRGVHPANVWGGSLKDKISWCSDRDFSARETSGDEIDADNPSRDVGPRLGGA